MKTVTRTFMRIVGAAIAAVGIGGAASGGFILSVALQNGITLTPDGGVTLGALLTACGVASLTFPIVFLGLAKRARQAHAAVEDLRQERDTLLQRVIRLEKSLEHVSVIGEIHVAGNIADRHERLHALLTAISEVTGAERVGLYLITASPEWKAILRGYYEEVGSSQVYLYVEGENDWWQIGDLTIKDAEEEASANRTVIGAMLEQSGENVARIEVESSGRQTHGKSAGEKLLSFLKRIRPDDGGLEEVFESPRPVVDIVAGRGRHLILYPLWAEGQMVGALRLEVSPEVIPAERVGEVTAALDEAAVHVALAVRKEQYRHRAEYDGLTGLFLKRHLMETLAQLCRVEAHKLPDPFSLLMIDIDHFKNVNDTFGHQSGDAVLKGVAGVIRKTLRGGDTAFRYGGEEMSVILPGLSASEARLVAERLRKQIEDSKFASLDGKAIPITVSIGVAEYEKGIATDDVIAHADAALYQSKKNGRNRVTVHGGRHKAHTSKRMVNPNSRQKAS